MHRQSGLSIIELMIALLISSILIAGVIGLFLTARETRTTSQHLNQVANDARFFTTFFAHDIRMAGFTGDCGSSVGTGLEWANGSQTLTIRYCNNGAADTIQYLFSRTSASCSGSGGNGVCYQDSQQGGQNHHLLDGLQFKSIWFGEQQSGKLQYVSGDNGTPDFSHLKTVRLQFTLFGNSLSDSQLISGKYANPTFDFTVAVRNNNL